MAQTTRSARATRPTRANRATPRTGTRPFARSAAPQTRTRQLANMRRRKPPQKKGLASTLTGLLPTGAAAKATPGSKKGKAGGFAALAAAAGVAFRNRDKLTSMLGRKGEGQSTQPATPAPPVQAAAPPAEAAVPRPVDTPRES